MRGSHSPRRGRRVSRVLGAVLAFSVGAPAVIGLHAHFDRLATRHPSLEEIESPDVDRDRPVELRHWLALWERSLGVTLVVDPSVETGFTIDVPPSEAPLTWRCFKVILDHNDVPVEERSSVGRTVLTVRKRRTLARRLPNGRAPVRWHVTTHVVRLKERADLEVFLRELRKRIRDQRAFTVSVHVDRTTRVLVASGAAEEIRLTRAAIRDLDTSRPRSEPGSQPRVSPPLTR